MVQISIPYKTAGPRGKSEQFTFNVHPRAVMLAGSRNLDLSREYCSRIVDKLHNKGFGFYVGCANGLDRSFRKILAAEPYRKRTFVACAFQNRTKYKYNFGLEASVVVPENISATVALARRTIWMARRCQLLVLFPDDPKTSNWGRGSRLAFNTATFNLKPVFLSSVHRPPYSDFYTIFVSSLFDVIPGYWVVPHPYKLGGVCDHEG
jgi:hypothetical protein